MLMTLMGRETSALPAEVLFLGMEIEVLKAYAKKKTTAHGYPDPRESSDRKKA